MVNMDTLSQSTDSVNRGGRKYVYSSPRGKNRGGCKGSNVDNNLKNNLTDQPIKSCDSSLYHSLNGADQNRFPRSISSEKDAFNDKYTDKKNPRIKLNSYGNFQNGLNDTYQNSGPVNVQVFRGRNRFGNHRRGMPLQSRIETNHYEGGNNGFNRSSQGSIVSFYDNRFEDSEKLYRYGGGKDAKPFRRGNNANFEKKGQAVSPSTNTGFSYADSNGDICNRKSNAHMNSTGRSKPEEHLSTNGHQRSPRKNGSKRNPLGLYWPKLSPLKEGDNLSDKTENKSNLREMNFKTELGTSPNNTKYIYDDIKSNDLPHCDSNDSVTSTKKTVHSESSGALAVKLVKNADDTGSKSNVVSSPSVILQSTDLKSPCSQKNTKSFKGIKVNKQCKELNKDTKEHLSLTGKISSSSEKFKTESICKKGDQDFKDGKVKFIAGDTAGTSSGKNTDGASNQNTPSKQKRNGTESNLNSESGKKDSWRSDRQVKDSDSRRSPPNNNNQRKKKKSKKGPHYIYRIELDLSQSFDEQAKCMVKQFEMTPWKQLRVDRLKTDLVKVFSSIIPNMEPVLFGSLVAGTAFTSSDVDVYLKCFECLPSGNVKDFILCYGSALNKSGLFRQGIKIPNARVPILKAIHNHSGMSVDISFVVDQVESHYGFRNSLLVRHLCSYDPRVRNLIMLVLFWAKYHGFVGKYQMSSFTFVLLAVFYLQIVEILPPLYKLITVSENSSTWSNAYNDDPRLLINNNDESLESLYLGFFTFYSEVRFDEVVISVYAGELILGVLFESMDMLPECYAGYKRLVGEGKEPALIRSSMCVQEPFNMSWNTVRSISDKTIEHLKHGCLNVCGVFAKFSSKRALAVVHSDYEIAESAENSYCWELPCPQGLSSKAWFEKIVKATKSIFTSIFLMDVNERDIKLEGLEFCKFYLTNLDEMNPVKLVISTEYMIPYKERKALVKAYKLKDISDYEKEVKASALLLAEIKKKGQRHFKAIIHVVRNEKNGCVEVTVNGLNIKLSKTRKDDHIQFVAFLKNDNFKNFLTLTLERDEADSKSEESSND